MASANGRAQTNTGATPVHSPNWSDPYQIVAPGTGSSNPWGIFPAAGELLGGGPVSNVQGVSDLDPYATPPTAVQLNAPYVVGQSAEPLPLIGSPLFQGGAIYNRLPDGRRLFPRLQQRINSRLYLRGDYLLWDVSGMDSPPLVTSSPNGTAEDVAAVLGEPGTTVLAGGKAFNDGSASGFLISSGWWVSDAKNVAIESEYFWIESLNDGYNASSDGSVILGRPYFDVVDGGQSARRVAYPGSVSGNIRVATESELESFLINGRISICPSHGPNCQQCGMRNRTDWLLGYRNIRQRDSLSVSENLQFGASNSPEAIAATDQFQTENEFNGLQLGFVHRRLLQRAWLETSVRVALGNNQQTSSIAGGTTITDGGVAQSFDGGLLAQQTNGGTRTRNEFMMVPELGIRLGIRLTERLHASIGYSVLYLPNVVRASEQIDTDVNPGLIPVAMVPLTGAPRPRFRWFQSDYLAQGLQLGGEFHF